MSGNNLNLKIRITGDGSELKAEIVGVQSSVKGFGQQAEKSGRRADKAFVKTRKGVESISKQLNRMRGFATAAFAFVGLSSGIRGLIDMSDTFTSVNARLMLATKSTAEFKIAQREVAKVARETRSSWEDTVDLYSRLGRATKDLDVKQSDLLLVTKALNQASIVSGSTTTEQSNAMIQLGQGLASGTLRGDELRSVLEQVPRVARAISDGMGIAFKDLRKLAEEGKITTEEIIRAIVKESATINEEFKKMPPTIAQAAQQVASSFTQIWGNFTTTSGAATGLSNAILVLADNLKAIATGALLVAKIATVAYASKAIAAVAATNTLTFSMVGLRSASLGLFMLYKSGGVKSVLAAPFISMAAATKAAFAGVSKLKIAGSLLFAAWAGWEIGRWLSDEFTIIKRAGIAMAASLDKTWEFMKFGGLVAAQWVAFTWDNTMSGLKIAFAHWISTVATILDYLPFTDVATANMNAYAAALKGGSVSAKEFAANLAKLAAERDKNIKFKDAFYAGEFADAGKTAGASSGNAGGSDINIPTLPAEDPLKKLLTSSDSLTRQLSDKYKSSFERISDQYSAMFDKLEALGKPGEARLEALSAAYDQFAENRWLKQEEARKSILSKGVDAIAESLLSENERRKQALDNRVAMLDQALDDGLISEERSLQLRNQLHADYDQQMADQKLQAMQDAETNANDLKAQFAQIASDNQLVNLEALRGNISQHLGLITQTNEKSGKKELSFTKAGAAQKLAFVGGSLKMLGGLMESHNRKAFEIGKAAAIADATVSTIVAVMKAWKDYGWPVGAALGTGIAAAGAINVAKIASTKFGGGAGTGANSPSVTGGASNVVALNPNTGIPQQASFNPTLPQQPTTPSIQIVQHITAPNAQIGTADAIQTAAALGAQQALQAVGQDFGANGPLRQQLAV